MSQILDEVMRGLLASSLKTASVDASGWHDHGEGPGSTCQAALMEIYVTRFQAFDSRCRYRSYFRYMSRSASCRAASIPSASAKYRSIPPY